MKFRKRPIVVEAWQWQGQPRKLWPAWLSDYRHDGEAVEEIDDWRLEIPTLEGTMVAEYEDWLIRGILGEIYPCNRGIFEMTYERVE